MTVLMGSERTGIASVPRHWRGPLPSQAPMRELSTPSGYAQVPGALLHGGYPDLGLLVWVWLRLEFQDRPGQTSYQTMSAELGLAHLSSRAAANKISLAVQPLLGTWIIRTKLDSNTFTYQAANIAPRDRYAVVRRGDLGMLALEGAKKAKVSDIANFGRWQLECGRRGWTAEPTRLIAKRWEITHPTICQSRDRLAALGLLKVEHRPGAARLSDLIWIRELNEAAGEGQGGRWLCSSNAFTGQQLVDTRASYPGRQTSHDANPTPQSVADLRQARADRRHRALIDLTAPPHRGLQRQSVRSQTQLVYLIHFPQEACYKVGITHAASRRIAFFTNQSGCLVDLIAVDNRALAELVEADVLALVEGWHRLGDPSRPGGGYTEMWDDAGPTVDLESVALQALTLVAQIRDAIAAVSAGRMGMNLVRDPAAGVRGLAPEVVP